MSVKFDTSDFDRKVKTLEEKIKEVNRKAINGMADEVLRLSQYEVPHDKGTLQNSGHVEPDGDDDAIVGYNTVYAARLHEHPEYHFQKGRKGKYLEDPIKNNAKILIDYYNEIMGSIFR
jgi:hypothetical protein